MHGRGRGSGRGAGIGQSPPPQPSPQQHGYAAAVADGAGGGSGRGGGRGRGGPASSRPCKFFSTRGHCREGDHCRFSHATVDGLPRPPPAPVGGSGDEDPFRVFKALSLKQIEQADQFRDFLGSAIASLSGSTAADKADTVLQMLCGVWHPPPVRGATAAAGASTSMTGGLYGGSVAAASAASGSDSCRAHLHLQLCMRDFAERHQRGKLTSEVLCGRVVPLLHLLTLEAIRESLRSHWVNPMYDTVLHTLDFTALASVYEQLLSGHLTVHLPMGTAAQPAAVAASSSAARIGKSQWSWQPSDWLDLLEPPLLLLAELLERFQQLHHREMLAQPATRLTEAVAALYDRHVGGDGAAVGSGGPTHGSRARRIRMTLRAVKEQLAHGQARVRILDEQETARRRTADASHAASGRGDRAAADRLRDPTYLPGALRPSGRRHDNDDEDYRVIQVVPTCQELLCDEWPYLPSNRPGSMPHLASELHRARLEVNFRLLRHDVVAPLATALQKFRKLGGLTWLRQYQSRQQQRAAATGRLELEGGAQLFVFRRVRVAGLAMTRQEGAYVKVTFDQPAMGGSSQRSAEDWWRNSKRLSHGTLLCFWWEPPAAAPSPHVRDAATPAAAAAAAGGAPAGGSTGAAAGPMRQPEPRLVVGVVARRDPRELGGKGSPDGRPMIGIRLVQPADHEALLGAWLDWEGGALSGSAALPGFWGGGRKSSDGSGSGGGGGGSGSEIVLVQEHNSFFAYEPVLRALQGITTIPLAPYIVPGVEGAVAASAQHASLQQQPTASTAAPAAAAAAAAGAELPAYWLDSPRLDLRHIVDRERVLALPRDEQIRVLRALAAVDLSRPVGHFPLEELLAASTLDRSQAEALRTALAQEVAVVQGPPGTGKTFLGVALAKVLLRNTCSSYWDDDDDNDDGTGMLRRRAALAGLRRNRAAGGLPSWIAREVDPAALAVEASDAAAAAERSLPAIGPLLVVCFTNHALDSFLEGLLDSGVTTSMVRVGGSSRSAKLEPYNLRNLQSNASGFQVKELLQRASKLEERAESLSRWLQAAADVQRRPLKWEELERLLSRHHPGLYGSFRRGRRPWNRKPEQGDDGFDEDGALDPDVKGLFISDADDGGWQVATGKRRGNKAQRRRFSDLVAEDWLMGNPELDWRRGRVVLESERQRQQQQQEAAAASLGVGGTMIQDSDDDQGGAEEDEMDMDLDVDIPSPGEAAGPQAQPDNGATAGPLRTGRQGQVGAAAALWPNMGGPAGSSDTDTGGGAAWMGAAAAGATAAGATATTAMLSPAQMAFAAAIRRIQMSSSEQAAAAARLDDVMDADESEEAATAAAATSASPAPPPPPPPPPPPTAPRPEAPQEVLAMSSRSRPLEELLASDDVWTMSGPERRLLHSALRRLRFAALLEYAQELQDDYQSVQRQLQAEYDQAALEVLRSSRVVGMTTSGVARNQSLVAAIKPRVLLVEEAAEVFEAHVLVCLSRSVEHLILIGDHEQLRPKPNEYDLQAASGRGLDLDVSLFERLVRQGGATGDGTASGDGESTRGSVLVQVATLQQQRRMRPEISQLIRVPIYPQLQDHPRVLSYPAVRGLASSLFFLDHDHAEGGGGGASGEDRSKNNEWEARFVVALARHLLLQGYKPEDLVILVPYVGQLFRVHRALEAANVRVVVSDRDQDELGRAGLVMADENSEPEDQGGAASGAGAGTGTVGVLPASGAGGRTLGGSGGGGGGGSPGGARVVSPSVWVAGQRRGAGGGGAAAAAAAAGDTRVVTMREGVRVATVDNFQGEEATVVLLSTVRNNTEGHIGFLSHRNRVNVMLSRARHGMFILGSSATLRAAAAKAAQRGRGGGGGGAAMWEDVLGMLERDGRLGRGLRVRCGNHSTETEIREAEDFERLVGDGGCQLPCGEQLPCGHSCPRRCHADDRGHALVVCVRPCVRLHKSCGHPCDKTCGQDCGRCERVLEEEVPLPCGHSARGVTCWRRFTEGAITCEAAVEVTLPGCGHTTTVPCCKAAAARAGELPCRQSVELEMPVCGHKVTVECSKRRELLTDPTACPAKPCGALLECGHECSGSCGKCMKRVLTGSYSELVEGWLRDQVPPAIQQAWAVRHPTVAAAAAGGQPPPPPHISAFVRFLSDEGAGAAYRGAFMTFLKARLTGPPGEAAPHARRHPACTRLCGKPLACGHQCRSPCHAGEPCGRCTQRCWIACPHHAVCRKPCGEPCVPCAEPCEWDCPHRGRCRAPCGAPCERLPCDHRCERSLPGCGHRCPGLCGEPCPPRSYCTHPDCLRNAPDRVKNQTVDYVTLRTLGELTSEELDDDPLVVLPSCGHAFLVSSLDGLLDLRSSYAADERSGSWLRPLPLGPDPGGKEPVKTCPQCREPIRGVRRYGRPVNKASLDLMDRKHLAESATKLAAADARLRALQQQVANEEQLERQLKAAVAAAEEEVMQAVSNGRLRFEPAAAASRLLAPLDRLCQGAVNIAQAFHSVGDLYLSPPKARVYEAAVAQLTRLEEELAAATAATGGDRDAAGVSEVAGAPGGSGGGSGSAHGGGVGGGEAAAALARGLETARADLRDLKPDNTQLCRAWCGILQTGELYLKAVAEGLKQAGRTSERLAEAAALKRTHQAFLYPLDPPERPPHRRAATRLAQLLTCLRQLVQQRLVEGLGTYQQLVINTAPGWVEQAVRSQNYNSAFRLAEASIRMSLAQLRLLNVGQALPRQVLLAEGGQGLRQEDLRDLQQVVVDQARATGEAALVLYRGESGFEQRALQEGYTNTAITAIQELMEKLQQLTSQVALEDILVALKAVAAAEYGATETLNWLNGHLYRCPNGHPYIIGNCGRAMELSHCPECGAAIGGGSHRLQGDNAAATELLQDLRGVAASAGVRS